MTKSLYEFALEHNLGTEKQRMYVQAAEAHGTATSAERALGVANDVVRRAVRTVKAQAARIGFAPEAGLNHPVAEGYEIKGYSHMAKDPEGRPLWIKTNQVRDAWEKAVIAAIEAQSARSIIIPEPRLTHPDAYDLIPWLNIGDGHIGMIGHKRETGQHFNIEIATREWVQAAFDLIDEAPATERFVINDLGDGTHYENFKAMTEASGHAVDFDTRFFKMIEAYYEIMEAVVEKALTKAKFVDVIINQGNHSRTNDIHIAQHIKRLYRQTGRVNVLDNAKPFIAYRMGDTLVLVHHGDKCRPEKLRDVMSTDYRVDWGETKFHYIDGGHIHHFSAKELGGATWTSYNNLAPMDKYAHDGGWRSKQAMTLVIRSRKYGHDRTIPMPIEKVWDRIRETEPEHYVPEPMRAFTV